MGYNVNKLTKFIAVSSLSMLITWVCTNLVILWQNPSDTIIFIDPVHTIENGFYLKHIAHFDYNKHLTITSKTHSASDR